MADGLVLMLPLPTLAAVVALIVGHPVPLTCSTPNLSLFGASSWTPSPEAVYIRSDLCDGWDQSDNTWLSLGSSLLIAIHEAEHIRYQDADEAVTECRALRDFPLVVWGMLPHDEPVWRYVSQRIATEMTEGAIYMDGRLAANYHGGVC